MRYKVDCGEYSSYVIDTTKLMESSYVCECFDIDIANQICRLLNDADEFSKFAFPDTGRPPSMF